MDEQVQRVVAAILDNQTQLEGGSSCGLKLEGGATGAHGAGPMSGGARHSRSHKGHRSPKKRYHKSPRRHRKHDGLLGLGIHAGPVKLGGGSQPGILGAFQEIAGGGSVTAEAPPTEVPAAQSDISGGHSQGHSQAQGHQGHEVSGGRKKRSADHLKKYRTRALQIYKKLRSKRSNSHVKGNILMKRAMKQMGREMGSRR